MTRFFAPRTTNLAALAAAGALLIAGLQAPALAHGSASAGALAGLSHPLLGLDHLLMLVAVGTAAALSTPQLLFWALGGGVVGALLGGFGLQLPAVELLAALAVAVLAAWSLLAERFAAQLQPLPLARISGALVAGGVMIHALLHGLEAPVDASSFSWWVGALLGSCVVSAGSWLLLRRLPAPSARWSAGALALLGVGLAL
jgi:urease accessory protein